ncbi:MAG: hypothetical protein NTU57_02305 [Candidatus Aenigmarchaeota archaeon]|nr:hypothetical protein [Candidatus Aenigmarchaeota archaeon]
MEKELTDIERKFADELIETLPLEPEIKKSSAEVPIIYDGRQYSIRIPKKFAEALKLDPKNDRFEFNMEIPPFKAKDNKPKLIGKLIKG